MKKSLLIFILIPALLLVCGCSKTSVDANAEVTLTFIYGDKNVHIALPDEEADSVIEILDGNSYDPITAGVPSCGFEKNISLQVGDRVFAIACDTCNCIQDLGNLKYFEIPQEDMDYIHTLFEKYGGKFPCI